MTVVNKQFEDVLRKDIGSRSTIFVFLFNVAAYIKDLAMNIERIIKPGDIIIVSQWNCKNECTRKIQAQYFKYVNKHTKNELKTLKPSLINNICETIHCFNEIECMEKKIVKFKIIYTSDKR